MHFGIYEHEWCFESSQNCTSRRRVQFENFQNITSDHKSRNARASSYDFLFIIYSTKLLLRSSLHALRTTSKALQWFPKYSHVLFEPIKNIMLWQGKSNVKFPKVSQVFSVFSSFLIWCSNLALPLCFHGNFHIALYNLHLHSITYLCIRHWPIRNSEICSVYNKRLVIANSALRAISYPTRAHGIIVKYSPSDIPQFPKLQVCNWGTVRFCGRRRNKPAGW